VERGRQRTYGLLAIIGLSTPAALVVETAARRLFMPAEVEQIRAWLGPIITPWVWWTLPATVLATLAGAWLYRWLYRRELARLRLRRPLAEAHQKAEFEALMLSTSAPQLPALAATMSFTLGADLGPVLAAIAVGTVGVLAMGLVVGRVSPDQREA
jgi:hypothetical protein